MKLLHGSLFLFITNYNYDLISIQINVTQIAWSEYIFSSRPVVSPVTEFSAQTTLIVFEEIIQKKKISKNRINGWERTRTNQPNPIKYRTGTRELQQKFLETKSYCKIEFLTYGKVRQNVFSRLTEFQMNVKLAKKMYKFAGYSPWNPPSSFLHYIILTIIHYRDIK